MALRPVDKLLAGYFGFVTLIIIIRNPFRDSANIWMLAAHLLFALLLYLFTRLKPANRIGNFLHLIYPLIFLAPLYSEIGYLNNQFAPEAIFANDAVVQGWEELLFGSQVSYRWIREYPSVFWSGLLHLAYVGYYGIIILGPLIPTFRKRASDTSAVLFAMMLAFVFCYLWFVLYPVAGPNWVWEHPTGPAREVWSARMAYAILEGGSSFGAAFPSSHVAASVATTLTLWRVWRKAAYWFIVPCALLIVATVYCQMHYAVDAAAGLVVGIGASIVGAKLQPTNGRRE